MTTYSNILEILNRLDRLEEEIKNIKDTLHNCSNKDSYVVNSSDNGTNKSNYGEVDLGGC